MSTKNFVFALNNHYYINVKERTFKLYQYLIGKYAVNYFENVNTKEINAPLLQKYLLYLSQNNLSTNTIKIIWRLIKLIIKSNEANINLNSVVVPKTHEKTVNAFSLQEQKRLEQQLNVSKKSKHIGILLALYLGLRIGELLALKWQDIDFTNKTISINRTVYTQKNVLRYSTPKTKSSVRVIPIPSFLIPILKDLKKNTKCEFVVSQKNEPISPRTYQAFFTVLQKKAKITKIKGFHALRHTFATRALECGMDIKSLADILGHKNPTVTLTRYAHSMMEYKKNYMNKIGKLYN